MVKKGLRGKTPILVLYAHGTYYSTSVTIGRSADVAALGEGGSTGKGKREGAYCRFPGMQVGHSPTKLAGDPCRFGGKRCLPPSSKKGGDSIRRWVVDRLAAAAG